jgi:dipeptidyl aminopeptidase/acylaminoacyl peptidase
MKILKLLPLVLFAAACASVEAPSQSAPQPGIVTPPSALLLDGVPPIAQEVADKVFPYGEFRPHGLWSWHPVKREMLIRRRLNATNQVFLVTEPGLAPVSITDQAEPINTAEYQPVTGDSFLYTRGEGGNEVLQIYRYDFATKDSSRLTTGTERSSSPRWDAKGERIVYTTQPVDRNNPDRVARTTLHLMDPRDAKTDKVLATFEGGGWSGFRFSEDGTQLVFGEYASANKSDIWVMDIASGAKRKITSSTDADPVSYRGARFSKDGKGVFATSDKGSEIHRLVYIPIEGGPEKVLTEAIPHEVDAFEISFDANMIAFTTNEAGSSVLRFIDLATMKEMPRPPLQYGVIGGLEWRKKSTEIGFSITSARSAGDVFSYDVDSNKLTRWTNGNNPHVNTAEFVEPRQIKWKSFDNREITGFLYAPREDRYKGKRPVIINIHGGPESQFRPGFIGRGNYYPTELGIAVIFPNVRGSSGFGKTFLKLDNGYKREDSVKDIGALLDWIKAQPGLDADHVMITGGSYGGYMTLACAFHFADRIASAASTVGISNFVTFLERTESYRRDLRRVEYGDERDPKMREFLEKISPLNNVEKITKPLFVAQGRNDPRVPYTEAEQIVKSMKGRGRPVWLMMAKDEGHGFQKKPNVDYQFYATIEFAKQTLLK